MCMRGFGHWTNVIGMRSAASSMPHRPCGSINPDRSPGPYGVLHDAASSSSASCRTIRTAQLSVDTILVGVYTHACPWIDCCCAKRRFQHREVNNDIFGFKPILRAALFFVSLFVAGTSDFLRSVFPSGNGRSARHY
jgi:hypothetical protein